jgi:hypothetical protein
VQGQLNQSVSPGMPKRGLGTQVAVFAVMVVCVVAAIGVLSLTQSGATPASSSEGTHSATSTAEATTCAPTPGQVGNATVTITQTAGQWSGCACALVDSNSNGTLYVSTNAVVGDDVCIAASMSASPIVSFEVVGPTGTVFSTPGCVNSAGTAVSCATSWNTAQLYPGGSQVQPGNYELIATGDSQSLRANFTLGAGVASSTTSHTCTSQSSSSSTSSSPQGQRNIASVVTPDVYFNNSVYQGPPVILTVKPGSHATMVVNVSYPWQNVQPPPAQGFCIEFSFATGPFPASSNVSTIPNWMHVSLSPPSIEIPYESSASVSLLAGVDSTAPKGSGASFELLIHYLDPASGNAAIGSYVVSVQT